MNSEMTTNSQLSTTESKKQKQTKQTLITGQNHRNGDHMEVWGGLEMGGRVHGIRSINSRYKIDRGRLRIA